MKELFKESKQTGGQTPGQTAMKGLFAETKESGCMTPDQVSLFKVAKISLRLVRHEKGFR